MKINTNKLTKNRINKTVIFIQAISVIMTMLISLISINYQTKAAAFTWTIGSVTEQTTFNNADSQACLVKDGSYVYYVVADAAASITNPFKVCRGSNIDNLTYQYTGTRHDFPEDYGSATSGNRYWITGLWVDQSDSNKWYALIHIEYNYANAGISGNWPMRRMAYATSTDKGQNWYWGDIIITSDSNDEDWEVGAGGVYDRGIGDGRLFVDSDNNYLYCYYFHNWMDTITGEWVTDTRVARCTMSSKMAPGSWYKFYNGSWTQAGLGGHDSSIFNGVINGFVHYNTYLQKFVAQGAATKAQAGSTTERSIFVATCTDMSTQNWTSMEKFIDADLGWYDWVWDTTNNSMFRTGQNYRYYSSKVGIGGWNSRYYPVTLGVGSTTPVSYPVTIWSKPLPDFDSVISGLPVGAYREDWNDNSFSGWTKIFGNGNWIASNKTLAATTDSGGTLYRDDNSTSQSNGYLSFSFKTGSSPVVGIFRYQAWNNYAGIYYDNGYIGWENGNSGWGTLYQVGTLDSTKWHRLEISYVGTTIKIWLDYKKVFQGTLSNMTTSAGKCGIRISNNATVYIDDWMQHSSLPEVRAFAETTNYVVNGGFEADGAPVQNPQGWTTWGDSDSDLTQTYGGSIEGTYHLAHFKSSSYQVSTYQTITGLANGRYKLIAQVKSSGGQTRSEMWVKNFGGTNNYREIPTGYQFWNELVIDNIYVTNNQCLVEFYSLSPANCWICVDEIKLIKYE